MIELKVRKFGDSLGVILPKEATQRLRAEDGQPLYLVEAPDGGYRLTPYDPAFEQKMAKAEEIIARYRNTLHVLALAAGALDETGYARFLRANSRREPA